MSRGGGRRSRYEEGGGRRGRRESPVGRRRRERSRSRSIERRVEKQGHAEGEEGKRGTQRGRKKKGHAEGVEGKKGHAEGVEGKKEEDIAFDAELSAEEIQMMMAMGIPFGFDSTQGKHIDDDSANVGAVKTATKRTARQYMNRKAGFNKPLPPEKTGEKIRGD